MPNKLSIILLIIGLGVGFVGGALWNVPRYDSDSTENVEKKQRTRELELMRQLSEARSSVTTLELLAKKDYKGIEEWQLLILDRHYDNLVSEQSIRSENNYESTLDWQAKSGDIKKLLDIEAFLLSAQKYENRLPSRNIPKKPAYPIEKAVADLLTANKRLLASFKDHQKKYLYRKWLSFNQFETFISYESGLDPSPGPETILFFYKDRLYAILHSKDIPYKSFVRRAIMSDYMISYLYRLDKKLEEEFDSHYREIIKYAD